MGNERNALAYVTPKFKHLAELYDAMFLDLIEWPIDSPNIVSILSSWRMHEMTMLSGEFHVFRSFGKSA